jgi:anti-anti-sigma factor
MIQHLVEPAEKELQVTFPGDLLSTNVETLRAEIMKLLDSPPASSPSWDNLSLDLRAARMVDSMGLNLLVTIVKAVRRRGGKVSAKITSPNIQRTFLFTRLDKQLDMKLCTA